MILFTFPQEKSLGDTLVKTHGLKLGTWEWRQFPDGESYVRVLSDVRNEETTILCSLNDPDTKTLPLIFLAQTLKELGARKVTLIAPYLGYMRQDARFKEGEAITSTIFAALLSRYIDSLVTVDPHLHRHKTLEEIYACECKVLSAAPLMAQWIKANVKNPLIIGPDMESEQWVRQVAEDAGAPFLILEKTRRGDREVEITLPDIAHYRQHTPVLADDIISTAGTMIKTIALLRQQGFKNAVCLATHGLFADDAYARLQKAGAAQIVTANTLAHPSNGLDIALLLPSASPG